jgi:hypothetical protein
MTYSETELCEITQSYWSKKEKYPNEAWHFYLNEAVLDSQPLNPPCSLLELEIAYARSREQAPQPNDEDVTLVILVGESFEPLLQSVWAHNPSRLVPVVNLYYGDADPNLKLTKEDEKVRGYERGSDHWARFQDHLEKLTWKHDLKLKVIPAVQDRRDSSTEEPAGTFYTVADNPTAVFDFLRQVLRADLLNSQKKVIIDITGAKKTMVVGAFMLAAYSQTKIVYIDTGRYDSQNRPYGFSCRFREVENPLTALSLESWEQVEERYARFDFAGALSLLETQLKERDKKPYVDIYWEGLVQLKEFLTALDHWDNGRLYEANEAYQRLPAALKPSVPPIVLELGPLWPPPGTTTPALSLDFFGRPDAVYCYGLDELGRAERLVQDKRMARLAFSRAYALYETLLKARVINLFVKGEMDVTPDNKKAAKVSSNQPGAPWYDLALDWCLHDMGTGDSEQLLQGKANGKEKKEHYILLQRRASKGSPPAPPKPCKKLRQGRNLATHSYFPITQEMAEEAIVLAQQNLNDYHNHWLTRPAVSIASFTLLAWDRLVEQCGLHFIPARNR